MFIVSTDLYGIAGVVIRCGRLAPFRRPAEISNDIASSSDVIMHVLGFMETEGK